MRWTLAHARRRPARARTERGAALVEFVLVLPFFCFFVFLLVNFGIMFSFRQELSQAATEGTRAAAVAPVGLSDTARVERAYTAVDSAMQAQGGLHCAGGTLTDAGAVVGTCAATIAPCAGDAGSRCVTVRVVHRYRDHPVVDVPLFLGVTNPASLAYTSTARVG